ncbi:MAG: hypothetical protein JWM86_590 [Thermoleophilia bacterium]|nr:hypothetical protein [Thermoleophilia bacterium]
MQQHETTTPIDDDPFAALVLDDELGEDTAGDAPEREPFDWASLVHLHPRLLLASLLVATLMVPVGFFLAVVGVAVLKVSGGAANDTSVVVGIAGFVVADFWGGGAVTALTGARAPQVAVAWGLARLVVLVLIALVATKLFAVLPVQLVLAVPAAWAGSRVARKQAALRRQIRAERTDG